MADPDRKPRDRAGRIAARLRIEAERARTSPHGVHPLIAVHTHAAALNWAAREIEAGRLG